MQMTRPVNRSQNQERLRRERSRRVQIRAPSGIVTNHRTITTPMSADYRARALLRHGFQTGTLESRSSAERGLPKPGVRDNQQTRR